MEESHRQHDPTAAGQTGAAGAFVEFCQLGFHWQDASSPAYCFHTRQHPVQPESSGLMRKARALPTKAVALGRLDTVAHHASSSNWRMASRSLLGTSTPSLRRRGCREAASRATRGQCSKSPRSHFALHGHQKSAPASHPPAQLRGEVGVDSEKESGSFCHKEEKPYGLLVFE